MNLPSYYKPLLMSILLYISGIACKTKSDGFKTNHQQVEAASIADPENSARPAHWDYVGHEGPAYWATLNPAYALCAEGMMQSPVNISTRNVTKGVHWEIQYDSTSLHIAHTGQMEDIVDNGHTIQVTVDEGSTLIYAGKVYGLKQFHFHTPSEHTIDGNHFPMELHLVHQSTDGQFAVIGVLFKEGGAINHSLDKIITYLPKKKGESVHVTSEHIDLGLELPQDDLAYHYIGSLTTPPCSENVQWLILHGIVTATKEQIASFQARIGPNNRPIQPLHERLIYNDDLSLKDIH